MKAGPTTDPATFATMLPDQGSLLALDASKRRLGVAGTDPGRRLVTALVTLARRSWAEDLDRVRRIVTERRAVGLVVGLPLNMDGTVGPMARAARELATALVRALTLPCLLQDERLSTFAVSEAIAEGRVPRPRRGEPEDHLAAAVILEDALRAMPERSCVVAVEPLSHEGGPRMADETTRPIAPQEPTPKKGETVEKDRRAVEQAMDPDGQAPRENYGKDSGGPPSEQHTQPGVAPGKR